MLLCSNLCHQLIPFHKGFLVIFPDQSSPRRVRKSLYGYYTLIIEIFLQLSVQPCRLCYFSFNLHVNLIFLELLDPCSLPLSEQTGLSYIYTNLTYIRIFTRFLTPSVDVLCITQRYVKSQK